MAKEKSKTPVASSKTVSAQQGDKTTFAFGKDNYKMMGMGIGLVALGMILMVGGASEDPNVFSEDIFNFQRLTLAPVLMVAGYVAVLLAILKKPKE